MSGTENVGVIGTRENEYADCSAAERSVKTLEPANTTIGGLFGCEGEGPCRGFVDFRKLGNPTAMYPANEMSGWCVAAVGYHCGDIQIITVPVGTQIAVKVGEGALLGLHDGQLSPANIAKFGSISGEKVSQYGERDGREGGEERAKWIKLISEPHNRPTDKAPSKPFGGIIEALGLALLPWGLGVIGVRNLGTYSGAVGIVAAGIGMVLIFCGFAILTA